MNLLFLIDSLEGGGAERACLNIAGELSRRHNVCVAAIFDGPDPGYYRNSSLRIEYLHIRNSRELWMKGKLYAQEISKLKTLKREFHTDCCISFLETANFLNVLSRTGERVIISIRNYYSLSIHEDRPLFHRIKARLSGRLADRVVGVSRAVCADLEQSFGVRREKLVSVYNYYDPASILKSAETAAGLFFTERIRPSDTVFVTSGRLVWQKGYVHLIRAFRKVAEAVPEGKLFIFGKGSLEPELRQTAARCGLEERVFFPGFDPAIARYYEAADIYVCSSMHEGFSNSLLEAVGCGLPVISTDCRSGPRELLAPDSDFHAQTKTAEYAEYGVLVPVCSGTKGAEDGPLEKEEEILADAMIRLASDIPLRRKYAAKSRERVLDFSPERIIGQWEEIICGEEAAEQEKGERI